MTHLTKLVCASTVLCLSFDTLAADCPSAYREIPIEKIESMFQRMRTDSKWNVDAPLTWGYFFFDPDQEKLGRFAEAQRATGYRTVELFKGGPMYTLHLEKVERHTAQSLFARNAELGALATASCVKVYDGFDVGR
jgi:hypothetical protein